MYTSKNGIIQVPSAHSFEETFGRLWSAITARGLTSFARIDFSRDAEKAGLKMLPTRMLIFGSPKGGTPVIVAAPTSAMDLPLRVLVSQDAEGKVWLSYNAPQYLKDRHGIPDELLANISGIAAIVEAVAKS